MKKLLSFLIAITLVLPFFACGGKDTDDAPLKQPDDFNGTKVVYVPLDNRPVNYTRAKYLAQSAGLELVMPNEEWLSSTLGESFDQGDPAKIFNWLKQQEGDYYLLSLDMLFSGGLVGSRAAFDDKDDSIANSESKFGEYTLSQTEKDIINYLNELSKTKHLVVFDTVMRLASTANYGGWDNAMYSYLRENFASVERKQLYDNELTVENIVNGYMYKADGTEIALGKVGGKDSAPYVTEYLRSRERKLVIAKELYSLCANNLSGLFIGVDDSTADVNIQTNEIRYLQTILTAGNESTLLFSGADELGLTGIAQIAATVYGKLSFNLQYFGDGKDYVADSYDPGTLSDCVNSHIAAVGGTISAENADIDLLVLTRSSESGTNATAHKLNVSKLITKLKNNLKNNIPTCVIDASAYEGYGALAQEMINAKLDLAQILGFSAWNTVGNSTGIAIANATARFTYLKNSKHITDLSHQGFYKAVAFAHIKDTAYKKFGNLPHTAQSNYTANYNKFTLFAGKIADLINNGSIYVSATEKQNLYDITASNLFWPWNRNFEADFNLEIAENGFGSAFAEQQNDISEG
ncbi:MAG: DUF4127 family protein [Clostridia bacterium]|nr:DUF4127 family protein [Clostridia bacterium]